MNLHCMESLGIKIPIAIGYNQGSTLLKGSWDLVTRDVNKVLTILLSTYNPN